MNKRKRSVLLSVMMLVLSIALLASGTYALFTNEVKLKNHLQAGTLDITLTRTSLLAKTIDTETGILVDKEDPADVDFSTPNNLNVFGIATDMLIVPCSKFTAEMQISNNSDVAFAYWLEIKFDDSENLELADQLEVTVTTDKSITSPLSQGLMIGSESSPIGTLAISGSQLFTVSLEFLDLDDAVNNAAKNQTLSFDLIVHAVQVVKAPAN